MRLVIPLRLVASLAILIALVAIPLAGIVDVRSYLAGALGVWLLGLVTWLLSPRIDR